MKDFPDFMRNPVNRIDSGTQYTPGIVGYVFDGMDGSQMAFWTASQEAESAEHTHEYDEYIVVLQGKYTLVIHEEEIPLAPGSEYFIPKGTPHKGKCLAGTRTIHAFGGKRCRRINQAE